VLQGTLHAMKHTVLVQQYARGDYFGELSLISDHSDDRQVRFCSLSAKLV
jgi:hypothetical protein